MKVLISPVNAAEAVISAHSGPKVEAFMTRARQLSGPNDPGADGTRLS